MRKAMKKVSVFALAIALATTGISTPVTNVTAEEISEQALVSLTTLNAPTSSFLYNFVDAGKGYQVSFKDGNDYSLTVGVNLSYQIYIANSSTPVATVSQSGEYIAASVIDALGLTSGKQYNFTVKTVATWTDNSVTMSPASVTSTFLYSKGTSAYNTGVAQVFITTSRTTDTSFINLFTDTSKTKVNSAITVKDTDGSTVVADNFGTFNVRGNSTALAAKKPYNMKFDSKQNLFGMGKAKKWSLLANIFDKTLIRNWIGLDFQRSLEASRPINQAYTSNCEPVDLYVDGTYLGSYLLVESVETGSTRVDIDDSYVDDSDNVSADATGNTVVANGTTYTTYDVLLEIANDVKEVPSRYDTESYYMYTTYLNEYFAANEPARANLSYDYVAGSSNKPSWLLADQAFLNGFEKVLTTSYSNAQTQYDILSQFIDVDSFVDFYITSEYFMIKDINFSSTRFYIKSGKLYAGPLWDLDLSSGNNNEHTGYTDFYAQYFKWFEKLMSNSVFASAVKTRYKELQPQIATLYSTNGTIDQAYNTILGSANKNYSVAYNGNDFSGWHVNVNYGAYNSPVTYNTYAEYVNEYKTWLKNRNSWLLSAWNISLSDTDATTQTPTEAPTQDSSAYTQCTVSTSDQWTTIGEWSYYLGNWNNSQAQYKGGINANNFTLNITSSNKSNWGIQAAVDNIPVVSGHQYRYTINLTSDKAGTVLSKDDISRGMEDITPISVGSNTITGVFTATSNTAKILLELASGIEVGTTLQVTGFSVVDLSEQTATTVTQTTQAQQTTQADVSGSEPIEVFGEVISCSADNTISVAWGQNADQINLGQTYNIYVDGNKVLSSVVCNLYPISGISAGLHTVKITAVLGNKETTGVTRDVNVTGTAAQTTTQVAETTKPVETTKPLETSKPAETTSANVEIAKGIELNGYQISTTAKGFRTVYSAEKIINNKTVTEVGLVYAIDIYADDSQIVVGSSNPSVASYAATENGVSDTNYSTSSTATSYIMTMKFDMFSAAELNRGSVVRAYAKLSDGSYVYSTPYRYSIYTVADYLYQNSLMTRYYSHEYLYNDILSVVDPGYKRVDFKWSNSLTK